LESFVHTYPELPDDAMLQYNTLAPLMIDLFKWTALLWLFVIYTHKHKLEVGHHQVQLGGQGALHAPTEHSTIQIIST
jgi:hypothetical protein